MGLFSSFSRKGRANAAAVALLQSTPPSSYSATPTRTTASASKTTVTSTVTVVHPVSSEKKDRKARRRSRTVGAEDAPKYNHSSSTATTDNRKKRRSWFGAPKPVEVDVPDVPLIPSGQKGSDYVSTMPAARGGRRKSFFGGKKEGESDVPAVPTLSDLKAATSTAAAATTVVTEQKEKRKSVFRSKSTETLRRRMSLLGGKPDPDVDVPAVPSVPGSSRPVTAAIPTSTSPPHASPQQQSQPSKASTQDAEKRKSVVKERRQSTITRRQSRRSRARSWLVSSSNPDHDSEINATALPSMPALTHSSSASDTSVSSSIGPQGRGKNAQRPMSCGGALSGGDRLYLPRSAAKGFLKSTTLAPEAARQSYRRSLGMRGDDFDDAAMFLSEEQMAEWERLKGMFVHEKGPEGSMSGGVLSAQEDEADRKRGEGREGLFSDNDALAALECGIAR
ncbi:hypothetical protein K431DRAFT_298691 [Polychaeton citri CBS 116435]|uniref:Uncharacterized protein n=1 Tax=Polychaeton citri CBS 116435 TaxID=1314669 RepID=A0A9P4UKY9_9PEZI|nr:hypothetical protein K431DRAFT_298691 [Polychaeton citri CBS 116435]